ncbi:hypothetical protein [Allobranchiibius sp. GilTou38]|uniref:hypothetical protein n=1 Tax=Allobranchiibius sp. GilTou38 TaxID=2815210 RepID=UPI001AA1997A|nr:hypothetical protein [Allobranchiibius sp. GilTou38]MBO1766682.1 hypothetical protein [Allobranchiibius sp. GilTou38]
MSWRKLHSKGTCVGCRQGNTGLKRGYCRMCWLQAARDAGPQNTHRLLAHGEQFDCHQLEFTNMRYALRRRGGGRLPWRPRDATDLNPTPTPGQLQLFTIATQRRPTRPALRRMTATALPHTIAAIRRADAIGNAHGWSSTTIECVQEALVVLLSQRGPADPVRRTEVETLPHAIRRTARILPVLEDLQLLVDDRPNRLNTLLDRRTQELPDAFVHDIAAWMSHLAQGGDRTTPRSWKTLQEYSRWIRPSMNRWAGECDSLREVTPTMVKAALYAPGAGVSTSNLFSALRSLFRYLKRTGRIFANPMNGLTLGTKTPAPIIPLTSQDYRRAVTRATTPVHRLVLALAGVHAARPAQIRALQLHDVDLWNRQLLVNKIWRRLDDLTRDTVLDWLTQRRDNWPHTANPHLIISRTSACTTGPVSATYLRGLLNPSGTTLDRIRMDRQLEEAIMHGPDPLHLQRLFGMCDHTAIRYARDASRLID